MCKHKKINYLIPVISVLIVSGLAGCYQKRQYTYETIKTQYAGLCDVKSTETALHEDKQKTAVCAFDSPLALSQAIDIAMKNNPDKRMTIARVRQSQAMLEASRAPFYPYVGIYTEYLRGDAPSSYLFKKIDQRELPQGTDFNDPGSISNFETGINAGINLYNGGKDILSNQMAEIGLRVAHLDQQQIENTLTAAVIAAYYESLAAEKFIKIAEESVSTVETQLRIMRVRFEAGGALKSDILSLEVRLAQAREDVVTSRNRLKMSLTAFARLMGIDTDGDIQLKETDIQSLPIPTTSEEGIRYGLTHRPDIEKMANKVVQARLAVDHCAGEFLPRLDIRTRYYFDDNAMAYEIDRDNWDVAVLVNWDIFTGFRRKAQVKKAVAALEEALAADHHIRIAARTEIKTAYLELEAAKARFEVAQRSVEMAEESLLLVKRQYEGGSVGITRYLEAELDRNRSKIRSTAAFYDMEKSIANIGKAIGYWSAADRQKNVTDAP